MAHTVGKRRARRRNEEGDPMIFTSLANASANDLSAARFAKALGFDGYRQALEYLVRSGANG